MSKTLNIALKKCERARDEELMVYCTQPEYLELCEYFGITPENEEWLDAQIKAGQIIKFSRQNTPAFRLGDEWRSRYYIYEKSR